MKPAFLLLAAALALGACKPQPPTYKAKREAAIAAASADLGGEVDLRWVVQNDVNGEHITCAYAVGPAPPGGRPTQTPVIIRAGKTLKAADVGADAFSKLQDQLCGPDWVKPAQ